MYKTVNLIDIDPKKYKDYKLCFVSPIEKLDSDFTEDTKEYMKSEEYKEKYSEVGCFLSPKIQSIMFNNKDYIPGVQEFFAYFTPLELNKQWGDDWDDAPYEHNAGYPYDDFGKGFIEILQVPFSVPQDFYFKLPNDYFYNDNSPWSVKNINMGAIPWVFIIANNKGYTLNAGISPIEFSAEILHLYNEAGKIKRTPEIEGFYIRDNELYVTVLDSGYIYFYKDLEPVEALIDGEDVSVVEYNQIYPEFSYSIESSRWNKIYKSLGYKKLKKGYEEVEKQLIDRILNPIKFIDGKIKLNYGKRE